MAGKIWNNGGIQQQEKNMKGIQRYIATDMLNDGGGERLGARERRDNALSARCSIAFPVRDTRVYIQ